MNRYNARAAKDIQDKAVKQCKQHHTKYSLMPHTRPNGAGKDPSFPS